MSYSDANAPGGGGGGGSTSIANGTTPITGGTDKQVIYNDGGVVRGSSDMLYDKTNNAVGFGAAPFDWNANVIAGLGFPAWQSSKSANGFSGFGSYNPSAGAAGWAGLAGANNLAQYLRVTLGGSGNSQTLLDSEAQSAAFTTNGEGGIQVASVTTASTTAHVSLGCKVGGVIKSRITLRSDGRGITLHNALTLTPTALSGAAIAATSALGVGNHHFSAPGANRTHTLVARSLVIAGYRATYSVIGSIGGFQIDLAPNGSDTIQGLATPASLTGNYSSVTLEACGTTDWRIA